MHRRNDASRSRSSLSRLGVITAVALTLALGAPPVAAQPPASEQPGEPAATAPRLSCLVTGDEANTLYGVYPTAEARCPNGLAVDLRLLRAAIGLP